MLKWVGCGTNVPKWPSLSTFTMRESRIRERHISIILVPVCNAESVEKEIDRSVVSKNIYLCCETLQRIKLLLVTLN